MNIKIRTTNFDLTPAIEEYVSKKVVHMEKLLEEAAICEVELGKTTAHHRSGDIFRAELNITDGGDQFYAVAEESDLYAAIDVVRDEIERTIVSKKKKRNTLFKRGAQRIKNMVQRWNRPER